MRAVVLKKYGLANDAFEIKEVEMPICGEEDVLIKVEAFGLNFADVMAVRGMYRDAPPAPCIIGYEVVGRVEKIGEKAKNVKVGDRVVGLTRFGGYAEYAVTNYKAVAKISKKMDAGIAAAIATQYCTAYYATHELTNIFPGEHVLIHAAAGGVGTALVQIAKNKGCVVYGTTSSPKKMAYLSEIGVDYPINYSTTNFVEEIKKIRGENGIDVVYDSVGGKTFKESYKLLAFGGRAVGYGAASRSGTKNKAWTGAKLLFGFGFFNPAFTISNSKSIMGLNMLKIADYKKEVIQRCMENVIEQIDDGKLKPHVGGRFKAEEIAQAHNYLSGRKSIGKIIVEW